MSDWTCIIAKSPPADGRDWEPQCARCGSSVGHETCFECGGDGCSHHDCGDDSCCCHNPEKNVQCDTCEGEGRWWLCLSGSEFCQKNPLPGREDIKQGQIEWYTFDTLPINGAPA